MNKADIISVLKEIAVLLEVKGENSFKIRAYQSGARTLERIDGDFDQLVQSGEVGELQGIGQALAQKITFLYEEGHLPFYDSLKASIAPGLIDCLSIPGLGGKKVRKIHEQLGVESIAALKEACLSGAIANLDGFGAKSAEKILSGIANREIYSQRHLWWSMQGTVDRIIQGLNGLDAVEAASVAGSYRRCLETVGDLDFIVASENPQPIMDWFTEQAGVKEVTAKGQTKSSVRFEDGVQADLRVVSASVYPFAAPPVLMVASKWEWDVPFMFTNFGWRATLGIIIATALYFFIFRKEFTEIQTQSDLQSADADVRSVESTPVWVIIIHLLFVVWTVFTLHHPALFIGGFLTFIAFTIATNHYQNTMSLKGPLLVGFFLAGLVTHGGLQGWWIEPVLTMLSEQMLFFGSTLLTAFNDNAAITFLASQVPAFDQNYAEDVALAKTLQYAVVAGAVTGGGLTVIANAPNPAGQSLLNRFFKDGIAPLNLFLSALIPTLIMVVVFIVIP